MSRLVGDLIFFFATFAVTDYPKKLCHHLAIKKANHYRINIPRYLLSQWKYYYWGQQGRKDEIWISHERKKVQNLTHSSVTRLRDVPSHVNLLLTTHVNNPFHGINCKVGEHFSNTFFKSAHIHFTKDFNEVIFLQLKNEKAFREVLKIKQFFKEIYNKIYSLTLYMKQV